MNSGAAQSLAVVIAAHGDRSAAKSNDALFSHRMAIEQTGRFASVSAGVLKGEPSLEEALAAAEASGAARIAVYPFFMADGFFVRIRLRDRVTAANLSQSWEILPPLGTDPGLPPLLLQQASETAVAAGLQPSAVHLLVVGHGSQLGPASASATRAAAGAVAVARHFRSVSTAFLEEPPSVSDALKAAPPGPIVVAGFFSEEGLHAGEDVPGSIAKWHGTALYAGAIGRDPRVSGLILAQLQK